MMDTIPKRNANRPDGSWKKITWSPDKIPDSDTEEEVSSTHECEDCVVRSDDVWEKMEEKTTFHLLLVYSKKMMYNVY